MGGRSRIQSAGRVVLRDREVLYGTTSCFRSHRQASKPTARPGHRGRLHPGRPARLPGHWLGELRLGDQQDPARLRDQPAAQPRPPSHRAGRAGALAPAGHGQDLRLAAGRRLRPGVLVRAVRGRQQRHQLPVPERRRQRPAPGQRPRWGGHRPVAGAADRPPRWSRRPWRLTCPTKAGSPRSSHGAPTRTAADFSRRWCLGDERPKGTIGMVSTDNTVARTLHDLGLAAWFGGSLMGATGVNGAAAVVQDPSQRLRVANTGWARWTPLNLAGIAAHLAGGAVLTGANKGRLAGQQGVATASTVKTALTVAALGSTAYARVLGKKLERAGEVPVEGGTTPNPVTPEDVARAQRQLTALQWMIPALTGALLVVNARMGEQQRPTQVAVGLLGRLRPGRAA